MLHIVLLFPCCFLNGNSGWITSFTMATVNPVYIGQKLPLLYWWCWDSSVVMAASLWAGREPVFLQSSCPELSVNERHKHWNVSDQSAVNSSFSVLFLSLFPMFLDCYQTSLAGWQWALEQMYKPILCHCHWHCFHKTKSFCIKKYI